MSKVDDELTLRLRRAERPVEDDGLFEDLERRRSHRERVRRVQAGLLAFAVLAATVVGFSVLTGLFDPDGRGTLAITPYGAEGAVVICGDETGGQICRIDGESLARGVSSEDLVRLTDLPHGVVTSPSVSHDGTTVVFELHDPPGANRQETAELWTIGTDGKGLQRLTPRGSGFTEPSWGPTRLLVAVAGDGVSADAALAILDPSAGPSPRVATIELPGLNFPSKPRWSPDNERILFSATAEPITDLYTVAIDGSGLTNITNSRETENAPTWSPDGRSIAFWVGSPNGEEIRICPADCSQPRALLDDQGRPIYGTLPAWSPEGDWIAFQVDIGATTEVHAVRIDGSDERTLVSAAGEIAWIRVTPLGTTPSVSPVSEGRDIGLGFNLCHVERMDGIDFLGDGTEGKAWTGTKVLEDGTCPNDIDNRYGVAADFTGDGVADTWSGETIESCVGCEPFKAVDLNGDGKEDLIVTISYFSIMQYGLYTVMPVDGELEIVPFRTGEPGHPQHGLDVGSPFTFWVGGDAGSADYFYCDTLPGFWLTGTESPIEPGPDDVTTIHETHVSLGTDGVAEILYANTFTVPAGTEVDLQYATSTPDCGLGIDIWR